MKTALKLLVFSVVLLSIQSLASDDIQVGSRHARHYVRPTMPEVARTMNLKGTVKLELEIAPNGKVTSVKPLGGHPLLVDSASRAVKTWQFEPASQTTTGQVVIVREVSHPFSSRSEMEPVFQLERDFARVCEMRSAERVAVVEHVVIVSDIEGAQA
jgi:TonB family protein